MLRRFLLVVHVVAVFLVAGSGVWAQCSPGTFLCPERDVCVATESACGILCDPLNPVLCANGLCVADASLCQPCDASSPISCADGTCAAFDDECFWCPAASPVRCADGSCASVGDDCSICHASHPIRCADATCVVSAAECASFDFNWGCNVF